MAVLSVWGNGRRGLNCFASCQSLISSSYGYLAASQAETTAATAARFAAESGCSRKSSLSAPRSPALSSKPLHLQFHTSVLSQNDEGMYRCQAQEDSAGALETSMQRMELQFTWGPIFWSLAFQVVTGDSRKKKTQSFKLACCIGDVSHNIISTTQLNKKGWSVIQSPGETYLYYEDSGTLISDVLLWGGTPWLWACRAAQPSLKDGSQPMELVESSMVEPVGLKVSMVGAVELSCQEKLRQRSLREVRWIISFWV